jgi:hypothetical protein
MQEPNRFWSTRKRSLFVVAAASAIAVCAWRVVANAQGNSGFPEGFDAVEAAPDSHRVIFENALVRVLEVTVPPAGKTEPMHHHRWPSFFLDWDTGGKSPHIRYHRPDGIVRDSPSQEKPVHPGYWTVQWMEPEPMHAIETVEKYDSGQGPRLLRVEIKVSR